MKFDTGLSPLARGTRRLALPDAEKKRFIPAGAGNSEVKPETASARPVYPRWRGELRCFALPSDSSSGLSPLARGTRRTENSQMARSRFIPAGAGNSRKILMPTYDLPVYPRWRGELVRLTLRAVHGTGLSPLARGTPNPQGSYMEATRFIPAGAGNSTAPTSVPIIPPVYPRWRGELIWRRWQRVYASGLSPLARGTLSKYTFVLKAFFPIKTTHQP
ncbi:hypothetical protein EC12741_0731 [Escherichia coli 1.2741]|nr:hypothetical protein ECSTEC7V_3332 [Escherichia coli STEC_7v]EIG78727.1 hypothetical protein EC12741_0731 [Escherichia coli 1.2741]